MPHAAVDDLAMYYEEHGQPGGVPLVLLHGFQQTGEMWRKQLPAFAPAYRLLVPDLRGHGRTNNPGGLPAMNHRRFARDIIAFCDALGISRAIFCGESTGAMLLLSLALDDPARVRALVLAGGTYFYGPEIRAWWRTQTPETLIRDPDAARARHTALGPEHWRQVAAAFIALGTHAHSDDFPEADDLRAIAAPTLIVHGDRDFFFPVAIPAGLYGLLPDAELCIMPRTGHVPPVERPDWFNAIVLDFLARRLQRDTAA
jgi:pimeloyl-ACP methyl ester carboxylesterase